MWLTEQLYTQLHTRLTSTTSDHWAVVSAIKMIDDARSPSECDGPATSVSMVIIQSPPTTVLIRESDGDATSNKINPPLWAFTHTGRQSH